MRVKAFTLVEVLVALLLLAIIGTLAMFILSNSKTAFTQFHQRSVKRHDMLQTVASLKRDLDVSESVVATESDILLRNAQVDVRYFSQGDSTVRQSTSSIPGDKMTLPSAFQGARVEQGRLIFALQYGESLEYFELEKQLDRGDRLLAHRKNGDSD